jgi:hypothetical protein
MVVTRGANLTPYVRAFFFADGSREENRVRELRVIHGPRQRGVFHTFRYVGIGLLAMGMLGGGLVAYTNGTQGLGIVMALVAFLLALGNLLVGGNQFVLVLTADALTLRRTPIPWWSHRRFALDDITVRAQSREVGGKACYFLEVFVGRDLARWGDFASLDDAARVAAFVAREIRVRQGRAPEILDSVIDVQQGRAIVPVAHDSSPYRYRLDGGDVVLFFAAMTGGVVLAAMVGGTSSWIAGTAMALGLSSLQIRRLLVRVPELTREEAAFTQPARRLRSLALIGLGATLALFGVLSLVVTISIVLTSHRFALVPVIPFGATLLGAALVSYGIHARPRS